MQQEQLPSQQCRVCKQPVGTAVTISEGGKLFHPECFRADRDKKEFAEFIREQ